MFAYPPPAALGHLQALLSACSGCSASCDALGTGGARRFGSSPCVSDSVTCPKYRASPRQRGREHQGVPATRDLERGQV